MKNINDELEKKINTLIQITGDYPEAMSISEQEYSRFVKENGFITHFRGVKLVVIK